MKKNIILLLLFFAVICVLPVMAQDVQKPSNTGKGRIILGTAIGASYTGLSNDDLEDDLGILNIEVDGGYFVIDDLAVGLISGYTHTKLGEISNWSINLGAFARYYLKPGIFLGAGYLYHETKDSESYGSIPVELGYAWFLNRNVALEPAVVLLLPGQNNKDFIYNFGLGLGIYLR